MAQVTIYTIRGCCHCVRAKRRLKRRGILFDEVAAGADRERWRAHFAEHFGSTTFPQIVVAGRHVGGATELVTLDRSGELDTLLGRPARSRRRPGRRA